VQHIDRVDKRVVVAWFSGCRIVSVPVKTSIGFLSITPYLMNIFKSKKDFGIIFPAALEILILQIHPGPSVNPIKNIC
jgi:hypothetical protein